MANPIPDPYHFFKAFPRFLETSKTGAWSDRLDARYFALIHTNRAIIKGARILDLASHDGRFSFAALQNGAQRVVGIELDPDLVRASHENLAFYDVPRDRYDFVRGDIFDLNFASGEYDVVFCFGILYHIYHHMLLFSNIAELDPRFLIIDSRLSQMDGAVIELVSPLQGSPPPIGSGLEGQPSKAGLDAMLSYFGWTYEYFDWSRSQLAKTQHMVDYRTGRRASLLVCCHQQSLSPEWRAYVVRLVLDQQGGRRWRWMAIKGVASHLGINPHALRRWVEHAERQEGREHRSE